MPDAGAPADDDRPAQQAIAQLLAATHAAAERDAVDRRDRAEARPIEHGDKVRREQRKDDVGRHRLDALNPLVDDILGVLHRADRDAEGDAAEQEEQEEAGDQRAVKRLKRGRPFARFID